MCLASDYLLLEKYRCYTMHCNYFWYFRIFLTLNSNVILDEKIYYREAI